MLLFDNIYKNKKVFITGNTGFKGSWLAYWLHTLGAEVKGYSVSETTTPSHFRLLDLSYETVFADILNKEKLEKEISDAKPDIVFHLAAQPLVLESYHNPVETFNTNVNGTLHVLEAIRKVTSVKAVVVVTTDKVYSNDNHPENKFVETDKLGGHDPYSASKACAEILTESYVRSFLSDGPLVATVRSGNVIGGGDWAAHRIIPDIIRANYGNEKLILRNPQSVRPWQHVLETINGYLIIGAKLLNAEKRFAGAWNFGPDKEQVYTVTDLIKAAEEFFPLFKAEKIANTSFEEAAFLMLDSSKALKQLGWKNVLNFNETVQLTFNWYRQYCEEGKLNTAENLRYYINRYYSVNAV